LDKKFKQIIGGEIAEINKIINRFEIKQIPKSEKPFIITNENINESEEKLNEITCSICLNIVNYPITQCGNCEEMFCEICIDKLIKNDCPNCKHEFHKQNLGRKLKIWLNFKKVNCPLDCGLVSGLMDFENHNNYCEKLKDCYQCSLCLNKIDFQEELKQAHGIECEKLKISCYHCKTELSVFDYEDHMKICNDLKNYCEKCNFMVCRKYQEAHSGLFCDHIRNLSLSIKNLEKI